MGNLYDVLEEVERVIDESKWEGPRLNKRDLAKYLDIPESKQKEIINHHSDESQRKHAVIEEFINNHPSPSWRIVAEFLYTIDTGDSAAVEFDRYLGALQTIKQKYLKGREKMSKHVCDAHLQ